MATNIIMPSLGFDMTEGKVAAWLKGAGDRVEKGEPVVEIETEKATVEVEAAASGILTRIVVPPGQTVPVGTVIGIIADAGEALPDERVKASPIARRMAEEAGIDLASIAASGVDGRVMERDVQAAIAARVGTGPIGQSAAPPVVKASLSRMRQAIARRMAESKATAPHFYASVEIRMDEAQKLRRQINSEKLEGAVVSANDMIVSATARALKAFPALNASWRDGNVAIHPDIGIGIAVALDEGLVTPVLHDAERKSLQAIAVESGALIDRARAGKLRPEDLSGGTFTISNMSMLGIDEFIAIINPPEAAILAVGAIVRRPVADGDVVTVALVMKVTLSVDHRVADGAQAARWLQQLRKLLEKPAELASGPGK